MSLKWAFLVCLLRFSGFNFATVISGNEIVPVLFWSPERSMTGLPDIGGDDVVQSDMFSSQFLSPLMTSHSAVVFLQDKLHIDDFTKFADVYSVDSDGGAFKNIKNLMDENFSLELPQVSNVAKSVEDLKKTFKGVTHTINSLKQLEDLSVSKDSPFLLLVNLLPTDGSLDTESVIAKNDEMMGAVSSHLSKRNVKYTALYSGEKASQESEGEADVHSGRHLLEDVPQVENVNGTFLNISDGKMFVFMKTINICLRNTTDTKTPQKGCELSFDIVPTLDSAKGSKITNNTASLVLEFDKAKGNSSSGVKEHKVKIQIEMINRKDNWLFSQMILEIEGKMKNGSLNNKNYDLVVPILYSWHCTSAYFFLDWVKEKDMKGTYVRFNGFQIQPFNIQNNRFFNSVDCVGFVTNGIWMGLFCVILLMIILITGTRMLLSLSIMDRYDDPKGKTISVNAGVTD